MRDFSGERRIKKYIDDKIKENTQVSKEPFIKAIIYASNMLTKHKDDVDKLNVFPVPDGDTGMNMNLTLASGAKEIANRNQQIVLSYIMDKQQLQSLQHYQYNI